MMPIFFFSLTSTVERTIRLSIICSELLLRCRSIPGLLPVQNGRFPDAEGAAGVGPLAARIPQALAGLAPHQHRRDVVDLVGRLGAGALLGLRNPTTFAPAPAGVEDQHQAQDGEQEGNHAALLGEG